MKLTSITFTGIDERTDLDRVQDISEKYPYVEWGVLLSYHWQENGNRYPNGTMNVVLGNGHTINTGLELDDLKEVLGINYSCSVGEELERLKKMYKKEGKK